MQYNIMGESVLWTNTENFLLLNVGHEYYVTCEGCKANWNC